MITEAGKIIKSHVGTGNATLMCTGYNGMIMLMIMIMVMIMIMIMSMG